MVLTGGGAWNLAVSCCHNRDANKIFTKGKSTADLCAAGLLQVVREEERSDTVTLWDFRAANPPLSEPLCSSPQVRVRV